jgi:hypothetical protein
LDDISLDINAFQYSSSIEKIKYLFSQDISNDKLYYLLGYSYENIGDKLSAIESYKISSDRGNTFATKKYEQLNPQKKRISHYVTLCCDGTISYSTGRGTCSWHGGVCEWNYPVYENYRDY